MKKYLIIILMISMLTFVNAELQILGNDNNKIIDLSSIADTITNFLGLSDTPSSYSGEGGNCLLVNVGEAALEFGACGGGGGGAGDKWVDVGSFIIPNTTFADNIRVAIIEATNWGNLTALTDTLYAGIEWGYNQTIPSNTYTDIQIANVNTTGNIESLNFSRGNHTIELDPIWSANFTNMQTDCPSGNYSYGVEGNGTFKCRDDLQGVGGGGDTNNDGLFINYTLTKTTGNITNGSLVGYTAADEICNIEVASGSHMCQMFEIINSVRLKGFSNFTATFRASEGAPGFTTNANDCVGWRDDDGTFLGSIWVGNNNNGGQGALVGCDVERAIGCCL